MDRYDRAVTDEDPTLPVALAAAHRLWLAEYPHWHDFEPEDEFAWSVETTEWWHDWTDNPDAGPAPFRVFGRDSTGGVAAFWTREPGARIETQPMVLLGSEGEIAVLARDLDDYLWLLAGGATPFAAVWPPQHAPVPIPALVALARQHTGEPAPSVETVLGAARAELPALEALVESVGR